MQNYSSISRRFTFSTAWPASRAPRANSSARKSELPFFLGEEDTINIFFAHTLFSFDFRWFYLNITEFPFRQTLVFYTEPFFADMLPVSLLRPQ